MRSIFFFINEAIIEMKRSALMIIISKITILVSLIIFGLFLLVNLNLSSISTFITNKLEVKIFLDEGLTKKEIANFQHQLSSYDVVKSVEYVDKSDAWISFKQTYSNIPLNAYIDNNPLPNMLRVKLVKTASIEGFATKLSSYSNYYEEINYGGNQTKNIYKVSRFILYSGWFLVVILSLATFLIMVNTIRLTIINRREEINIMKLVGATDNYIIGPFIFEGLILGVFSSLLAIVILKFMYQFFAENIMASIPYVPIVVKADQLNIIYCSVGAWGIVLSIFAAFISLKGMLNKKY